MAAKQAAWPYFSKGDLSFVVGEVAPRASDPAALERLLAEDAQFRAAMLGDDALLARVQSDDEVFLYISPALYFEILLRHACKELETAAYTREPDGRSSIPVFDTPDVLELVERPGVVEYLASMLASFTRIESRVVIARSRRRRGIRRRIRYSDMDVDSLMRFGADAPPEQRFGYYKRIADVCLFVSGVFPSSARGAGGTGVGASAVSRAWRMRRTIEDYEREGRIFYGLAESHPAARELELDAVFAALRDNFSAARKPLAHVATRFLHARKRQLFAAAPPD